MCKCALLLPRYLIFFQTCNSSCENTNITTGEQPLTKNKQKPQNLPKKILYMQIQRRSHNEMLGGALLWCNQIPYPPGGWPTNQKIIILQEFSYRSESFEPHIRLPSLGIWYLGEGAPRAFGFEDQQGLSAEAPQDWGKQGLCSWRMHEVSCPLGPRAKQWLHRSLGRPTCASWRAS